MAYISKILTAEEYQDLCEKGIVRSIWESSKPYLDISRNYDYREAVMKDWKTNERFSPEEIDTLSDDDRYDFWERLLMGYVEDNNPNADLAHQPKYLIGVRDDDYWITLTAVYHDTVEKTWNICLALGRDDLSGSRAYYFTKPYHVSRVAIPKSKGCTTQVAYMLPDSDIQGLVGGSNKARAYDQLHDVYDFSSIKVENIDQRYYYKRPAMMALPTEDDDSEVEEPAKVMYDYTVQLIKHSNDYK